MFEGEYKIDFFESCIFNFLDKEVIIEKTKELKEIINSFVNKNSTFNWGEKKTVQNLLDQIDLHNDIEGSYSLFSNMDISDIVSGVFDKKRSMLLEYGLQKDEYALTNDDFVATMYYAKNKGMLPEKISDIFDRLKTKSVKPDMSKYQEEVDNLTEMDETKFESFIEDLKKLKNCEEILPEEYCDYLIKQKMDSNSCLNKNLEKYFTIFKRVYEDKTQYVLANNGIDGYVVKVYSKLDKEIVGQAGSKYIVYNEEYVKNLSEKNMHVINTMFHEIRHIVQNEHIENPEKINPNEYKMLKEQKIRESSAGIFYYVNYESMYNEIDARIHGAKGAYKYLKQLGLDNNRILDYDQKSFFECYKENQKKEMEIHDSANEKNEFFHFEEKKKSVNYQFRECLKNNLNLLNTYPILKLEYNEKGERKSGFEILRNYAEELKNYEENPQNTNINKLSILSSILKEKGTMYTLTKLEDSRELLRFNTDNNIVKRHRDYIIENEFLNTIRKNKDGVWTIYVNETKEESKEHFDELVNNLFEFTKQNPEEPITKKILKEIEPYVQSKEEKKQIEEINQLREIDAGISDEERNEAMSVIIGTSKTHTNDIEN